MEPLLARYMMGSMIYGGVRKTYQMYDAVHGKDEHGNPVPVLWGDKLCIIGISTAMSWIISPSWITKDINSLHCLLYNIKPLEPVRSSCPKIIYSAYDCKKVFEFVNE